MTAWVGLFEIGLPKLGETVVVSAAGGAVGTVVGQLAKAEGCRVIGLTSTREKAQWLETEVGYDRVIDRETQPHLANCTVCGRPGRYRISFLIMSVATHLTLPMGSASRAGEISTLRCHFAV